ncbi:MAG: hypothetical protein N0E48_11350, partial [Candidatus Thiodiazotropha endolucinida]|nr:hypothetical protein [Candidatus Thiodiazotropha taylori]MCW4343938.1 hypothetical protein [Candidatus Thiodiazotropha endolucinida]
WLLANTFSLMIYRPFYNEKKKNNLRVHLQNKISKVTKLSMLLPSVVPFAQLCCAAPPANMLKHISMITLLSIK